MDPGFPYLLLLLSTLHYCWQRVGGQPFYIIDTVNLTVPTAVKTGTPVNLTCEVSISHIPSVQLTHAFKFTRDDVPVHNMTTADTVAVYILSPARAADSGTYECEVKVQEKSKTSSAKTLMVTGLQTPVLNLSNTQPFEHEEIVATCSAPEEKGDLRFFFYQLQRSGVSEVIKQPAARGNSFQTKLVLSQIGDTNLYCDYILPMLSAATRSNNSNKVPVLVKAFSITPVMNVLPSATVFEGDVIDVTCKVINKQGKIDVFLTKDKTILKKATGALNHRYKVHAGDSGQLVCKAEWGSVQKESYLTIIVRELFRKPRLRVMPEDVFEGEHFSLNCSISYFAPEVVNIEAMQFSIFKNGVQLTRTSTYSAVANASENGNYTCTAMAYGKTVTKESVPEVIIARVPVSQPTLSVLTGRLVLGKPFRLRCHSEKGSLPVTYTLYGPSREPVTMVVNKYGERANFNTTAIYKDTDIRDFLCHANNRDRAHPMTASGQMLLRTTTIIEPVSKPVLVVDPRDVSEGWDMKLVCSVQRGTPPITFTWYHREKKEHLFSETAQQMQGSYDVKGVRDKDRGDYYCIGTNQAGDIKRSYTVMVEVKMAGWKKGLIAVVCLLLMVALILAILIKKGLLPFRRSRSRSLSVKSAGTKVERLSLTQAEVIQAANVTPSVMGKSVWSEHISGSDDDSDDQHSVGSPEEPETQYTEVQVQHIDPSKAPVKNGTETVNSEVQTSKPGVAEQADGGSVEYAQLNRDNNQHSDHCSHGDRSRPQSTTVHVDHIDDIDEIDQPSSSFLTQPDGSN